MPIEDKEFNGLDKRVLELKKDVEWQQKVFLLVGGLLLAILGYTSLFQVPREVSAAMKADIVKESERQAKMAATNAVADSKAIASILAALKPANFASNSSESGCVMLGDVTICWGQTVIVPTRGNYSPSFSATFPHTFQEPPTVTMTFSVKGRPSEIYSYAICDLAVTKSNFSATAWESQNKQERPNPVILHYIAVGK